MEWWGVSATLLAAASLVAVVWQILRFEATTPTLGWSLTFAVSGVVRNGMREVRVAFRPIGPVVLHEVEAQEWGAARVPMETERARMDCDSEPLVADAKWVSGEEAYVGFTWLQPSLIRRTPVRQTIRRRLPDGEIELWKWHRIPRPEKWHQGRWTVWNAHQERRTFVPDMWGMPGSK